ncbi:tol-pal system protein YbgF [Pseudohoeflea coraliihabitans]|uniref:Cell division coordinator CpoB n=1 Tax=Pseudohoeflea coraliihabitans TaxID=2860393 RepID=A0ABS6WK15_9HYPH|nr:tol-pal system protein YbgF [Pseudohoeflea sp. DP4N28-3]MBW3096292.1 tol-pal system protein YbgF [Pseudohoeflea sp. DP4N28-3]
MKKMRRLGGIGAIAGAAALTWTGLVTPVWSGPVVTPQAAATAMAGTSQVIRVQSGDAIYRIGQLEEQVRGLNGRIEELGFQLLQMEERMRQMQEDNEFRFQQLEGGSGQRSDAGSADGAVSGEVPMDHAGTQTPPGVEDTTTASTAPSSATGAPPRTLGTLTFDENGNAVTGPGDGPATQTASLDNPDALYQAGYDHILAGDYQLAESVFRDFADIHPDDPNAPNAMFWLGEAQFSQGRYSDAAQTFLDAHKRYPQADKGADTMLKLGMSLAALDKLEAACATYRQLASNYPAASPAVRKKAQQEQTSANC